MWQKDAVIGLIGVGAAFVLCIGVWLAVEAVQRRRDRNGLRHLLSENGRAKVDALQYFQHVPPIRMIQALNGAVASLADVDVKVRWAACQFFTSLLIRRKHFPPHIAVEIKSTLIDCCKSKPEILAKALRDPDEFVRAPAAWIAAVPGYPPSVLSPSLLEPLLAGARDESQIVRRYTLLALASFHDQASRIVPEVIDRLDDPDDATRAGAAGCLASFGSAAAAARTQLARSLESKDPGLQLAATRALFFVSPIESAVDLERFYRASVPGPPRLWAMAALCIANKLSRDQVMQELETFTEPTEQYFKQGIRSSLVEKLRNPLSDVFGAISSDL